MSTQINNDAHPQVHSAVKTPFNEIYGPMVADYPASAPIMSAADDVLQDKTEAAADHPTSPPSHAADRTIECPTTTAQQTTDPLSLFGPNSVSEAANTSAHEGSHLCEPFEAGRIKKMLDSNLEQPLELREIPHMVSEAVADIHPKETLQELPHKISVAVADMHPVDKLQELPHKISAAVSEMHPVETLQELPHKISVAVADMHPVETLQELPHKISSAAHTVSDTAQHVVSDAVHTTTETLHDIQNKAKHAAEVTTNQTVGAIHTLQEKTIYAGGAIQERVVSVGESFQDVAIATADAIHDKAVKMGETFVEKASAAGGKIVHAAESLVDKADAASDKAVHAAEAVASAVAGAAHNIVEGAKAVVEAIKEKTADRPALVDGGFLHKGHKHPISHTGGVESQTWAPDSEAQPSADVGVELKDLQPALKAEEADNAEEIISIDDLPVCDIPAATPQTTSDSDANSKVVYERIFVNTNNVAEAIDAMRARAAFEDARASHV